MLASSRKPCDAANSRRRAKSPALQSPCKRAVTQKAAALCQTRRRADAIIGPYAEGRRSITVIHPPCPPSRLCRPFALHCRAGVHARRGALRRPGRVLARQGAAPLSRLTPTAPLTGEPSGWRSPQSLPCKGLRSRAPPAAEKARRSRCSGRRAQACFSARRAMRAPQTGRWMRRKAQTEGCIAALPHRYPAKPGRTLPPHP